MAKRRSDRVPSSTEGLSPGPPPSGRAPTGPPPKTRPGPASEVPEIKPVELAKQLEDPAFRERIETAVANLPPDKAAELVALLEASMNRRKVEFLGYISAALVLLVGMVIALYVYGRSDANQFRGWLLLLPLAAAGLIMIAVARWAKKREAQDRQQRSARQR